MEASFRCAIVTKLRDIYTPAAPPSARGACERTVAAELFADACFVSQIYYLVRQGTDHQMVEKRTQGPKPKKRTSAALVRRATKTAAQNPKAGLEQPPNRAATRKGFGARGSAILSAAMDAGYLRGEKTQRIGGRVTSKLLSAAKAKSGLTSQTELLEYALSMVALEDDYGATLLSMKGSIPDDVEL